MYSSEYLLLVRKLKKITLIETVLALLYILSVLFGLSDVESVIFLLFLLIFILLILQKRKFTKFIIEIVNENESKIKRHTREKKLDIKSFIKFNKRNTTYTNIAQEIKNKNSKDYLLYNDTFIKLISKNYKNEYLSKKKK